MPSANPKQTNFGDRGCVTNKYKSRGSSTIFRFRDHVRQIGLPSGQICVLLIVINSHLTSGANMRRV